MCVCVCALLKKIFGAAKILRLHTTFSKNVGRGTCPQPPGSYGTGLIFSTILNYVGKN